ncbi:MAG: MBL fold metallo-hydrolase [Betaproteobacteria bacterium]|nr:MBL fold metallo-hydrolase [Betaproteobacteria bacterium]
MKTKCFAGVVAMAAKATLAVLIELTFAAPAFAQRDFSKVVIKTTQLASDFYALEGDGGTIGILTGPDGIVMVDSQFAALSERIFAAIRQVFDGRVRFLINTHLHGDHVGGNENMAKTGAMDRNNGGTIAGMLAGFDAILKLASADTKIVPGHGAVVDKSAVAAHKDIMIAVRDRLAALVRDGKTLEEAIAAKLTADFDARVPGAAETSTRFITQMYGEMKAGK